VTTPCSSPGRGFASAENRHSYRTEEAHVGWARRCVLFHNKRPTEMGPAEIRQFPRVGVAVGISGNDDLAGSASGCAEPTGLVIPARLLGSRYCIGGSSDRSKLCEGCNHGNCDCDSSGCRVACVFSLWPWTRHATRSSGCRSPNPALDRTAGMTRPAMAATSRLPAAAQRHDVRLERRWV